MVSKRGDYTGHSVRHRPRVPRTEPAPLFVMQQKRFGVFGAMFAAELVVA
jgi:hypothetical protein